MAQDSEVRSVTPKIMSLLKSRLEQLFLNISNMAPRDPVLKNITNMTNMATRIIDTVRPGVRVSELLGAAQRHVKAAGLTETVGEVAGHGIGLEHWERPIIQVHEDPDDDVAVLPGMVLCLEPILAPAHPDGGLAGVFVFEQQVLVTDTGCEVLSGELPARLWRAGA